MGGQGRDVHVQLALARATLDIAQDDRVTDLLEGMDDLTERLREWEGDAITQVARSIDEGHPLPPELLDAAVHELLDAADDAVREDDRVLARALADALLRWG